MLADCGERDTDTTPRIAALHLENFTRVLQHQMHYSHYPLSLHHPFLSSICKPHSAYKVYKLPLQQRQA